MEISDRSRSPSSSSSSSENQSRSSIQSSFKNESRSESSEDSNLTDEEMCFTNPGNDNYKELIHPSINISVMSVLQLILIFFLRHNLTQVALEDLLLLINTMMGNDVLPKSKYFFFKIFSKQYAPQHHFFCKKCNLSLDGTVNAYEHTVNANVICKNPNCKQINSLRTTNSDNFFVTFPLKPQLLETITENLDDFIKQCDNNNTNLTDIQDGKLFKNLPNVERHEISLTLNTDGVQVFNSKSKSLWPVQLMINNLSKTKRFLTKNVIVTALYFNSQHPSMETLLKPLIDEINNIQKSGLKIFIDNKEYIFNIRILCSTLDAPAKAAVQNIVLHNGYSSCHYCEHPGTKVGIGVKYPNKRNIKKRTHIEAVKHMKLADEINLNKKTKKIHKVKGFKGKSPLLALKDFDIINGFAIDYMHSVLLGIVRKLMFLWFETENFREEFYIRKYIPTIDEYIKNIKLPIEVQRKPRSLLEKSNWKANELRTWLLHYSVGALYEFLPIKYLNNYIKLVTAVKIYLQPEISPEDLLNARQLIVSFVTGFEVLYGKENMVYNLHTITHLPDCVENLGPVWAYSNFAFENNNGKLVTYVKSPKGVLSQISSKYTLRRKLNTLKFTDRVADYEKSISKVSHLISSTSHSSMALGKPNIYLKDDALIDNFDFGLVFNDSESVLSYSRFSKNNIIYSTNSYCFFKKSEDSIVKLKNNTYGRIEKILFQNNVFYLLLSIITVEESHETVNCCNYIKIVTDQYKEQKIIVAESLIECKCILVNTNAIKYIVEFNNFADKD